MIRFALTCSQGHGFEGWFKSNAAFDAQAATGRLECPVCGGAEIRKAIMAPAITRGERQQEVIPPPPAAESVPAPANPVPPSPQALVRMMLMMRAVREHVERNFDNVGAQFPEEARKIHYGERDPHGIFGEATGDEVRELIEEGIEIMPLPVAPKLDD